MQAATQTLVAIHKHLPGEATSVEALVRQAAVCGPERVRFMMELQYAGLGMRTADWAFFMSQLPPSEVHAPSLLQLVSLDRRRSTGAHTRSW